jgi:hypothetical protein
VLRSPYRMTFPYTVPTYCISNLYLPSASTIAADISVNVPAKRGRVRTAPNNARILVASIPNCCDAIRVKPRQVHSELPRQRIRIFSLIALFPSGNDKAFSDHCSHMHQE